MEAAPAAPAADFAGPPLHISRDGSMVIPEFAAYKATRLSDIVCKRHVRLYRDRVQTVHPHCADQGSEKTWYLDRTCKLEPEYVEELVSEKRTVRPPGQWTVTAKLTTVTGQAQELIDLYCVTITWPTSWLATRGYTSFTLGFETLEAAAQWHSLVQRQLSALRVRAVSSKGDSSTCHSSKPSYDEGMGARTSSGNGAVARKTSQGFVAAALEHFWSSGTGAKDDKQLHAALDGVDQGCVSQPCTGPVPFGPLAACNGLGSCQELLSQQGCYPAEALEGARQLDDSFTSSETGMGKDEQLMQQAQLAAGCAVEQRWVPYRHTNGVAIYHHKEPAATRSLWDCGQADGGPAGSEYMASSIVKGCPDECLSVLVDLSSNTTILGPASKIELLEDGEERQVLRLTVEATGMARRLCAPREVIVERLFKREECGVDVVLFSSCEEPPALLSTPSGIKQHRSTGGAAAAAAADSSRAAGCSTSCEHDSSASGLKQLTRPAVSFAAAAGAVLVAAAATAAAAGSWACCVLALLLLAAGAVLCSTRLSTRVCSSRRRFQSLWYKPVRAYVQGGYTISPREDCNAINSPECLVTCILKVDLRGLLGERSWLQPVLHAVGWVDAYVERMLMAVILVKDEVEQQRFLVQPFSILTNNHAVRASNPMAASASADDSAAGDADEAAALREGYSQHLRQQQLMRQRRRQLQLQLQQQQQQQQAAYMHAQAGHMPFGPQLFAADEAARLAVHGYWGSGATTSGQAGVLRASAGMYGPQGTSVGLLSSDSSMAWAYKGANGMGPAGHQGSFSQQQQQQQQDLLLQRSDSAGVQVKRSSSQSRQQGRLGRMASRIYSLRPRLRKADSGTAERAAPAVSQQAAAAAAAGLYSQFSASFKHGLSVLSAGDNAAASAAAAASGTAVPASQGAGAAAAATAEAGSAETASAAAAAPAAEAAGAAALQQLDLGDAKAVLSALGLPADTAVVGPQYYAGGPHGPVAKFSTLNPRFWSELHVPGTPAPFKLRSASYLTDRTKVEGGMPQFVLGSVDLVETAGPTQHISRFLPAVRCNDAAYSFVVNLIIPGTPVLSLVAVFINEHHPDILDGPSCSSTSSATAAGASHHVASSSSPALAAQEQQHQQPNTLRRLSSSSTNLPAMSSPRAAQLAACSSSGTTCLPDSPAAAAAAAAAVAGAGGYGEDGPSRYATPVGGRAAEAASKASSSPGSGSSVAAAAAADNDADAAEGPVYQRPRDVNDWQPFDFALHRFLHGPATRQSMFKLIPHIAEGSWVIKQSVGTVPVILGNKLQTVYYQTDRYIEATVDVTSSSAAAYITGMVRGATKSLVIDLGFVLEGQQPEELPEALLGAFRLNHLDCGQAKRIDTTQELPLLPRPLQQHQLAQMAAAAAANGADGARAAAAAAVTAAGAAPRHQQGPEQQQAGSDPGAVAAAASAAAAAAAAGGAAGSVTDRGQRQPQPQQSLELLLQQQRGQSCSRNSASVLETGRTMTAHARSRSATSVEELYLSSGLLLGEATQHREQHEQQQQRLSVMQQVPERGQQQAAKQAAHHSSIGAAAGTASEPGSGTGSSLRGPASIKTAAASHAGSNVAPGTSYESLHGADPGAPAASAGQGAATGGGSVPSTARQLFGSLLPFGSSNSGVNAQQPTVRHAEAAAAAAAAAVNPALLAVAASGNARSLSESSTPTAAAAASAASMGGPRNAAAAAAAGGGGNSLSLNTAAGTGGSSQHGGHPYHRSSLVSTPTAAAGVTGSTVGMMATPGSGGALQRVAHHRSSSGTSDAASRTPVGGWPASPPSAGSEAFGSKLSAAAFISRAHAAALAASAQRRGQRSAASATAGGVFSSSGFSSIGSPAGFSALASELSGSPGAGNSAFATGLGSVEAEVLAGGCWQGKRPRVSGSGGPEAEQLSTASPQQAQEAAGSNGKISASEQLRLTHHALRASATGQGGGGAGGGAAHAAAPGAAGVGVGGGGSAGHHHASSSFSSSMSGMLHSPGGRQSSASGAPTGAVEGSVENRGTAGLLVGQQQVKRRVSNHRRFASMGANVGALQ